ncbi:glutamine amidotransferase-related protein [Hahella ganghwensis]|uniref:glutamine amidotransferase-related protein n=1 Tax=Hahella ganghwensis TaxID=286420 RepID=UPI000525F758|nr:gamma-glutamyl-gamma-aminobutyrate hydrolase family protein [Hahella ganghwensis]
MKTQPPFTFRLGILQCDHVMPDLRTHFGDYPEMFRNLFREVAPELQYRDYDLTEMEFPESPDECDAWLFTGSKWSVYDDEAWIHRALDLARTLHESGQPVVGICFGHQLLTKALGGEVVKSKNGWGVGLHRADMESSEPWMQPALPSLNLLVSHQDQVTRLPQEARRLASHDFCPNDIMQIGNNTLTFQGHPEFTAGYSKGLMEKREDILGAKTFKEGIASLARQPDKQEAAQWIVNFIAEVLAKSNQG